MKRPMLIIGTLVLFWGTSVFAQSQVAWADSLADTAKFIIEKYRQQRLDLDNKYVVSLLPEEEAKRYYRIGRRMIVFRRQQELLGAGVLIDDTATIDGKFWRESVGVNSVLKDSTKLDADLLCPDDPHPHDVYPRK